MADRDPMPGLDPVGRPLPLARQRPLCAGQAPFGGAQVPRIGDLLDAAVTSGDRREYGQAKVDPGCSVDRR